MTLVATGLPDLLKRFIPAPHRLNIQLGDVSLTLETNDPDIVSALQQARVTVMGCQTSVFAKLIRDYEVKADGSDRKLITAWPLAALFVGKDTMLALDCDRHELVGFVGPSIAPAELTEDLLPTLLSFLSRDEHLQVTKIVQR